MISLQGLQRDLDDLKDSVEYAHQNNIRTYNSAVDPRIALDRLQKDLHLIYNWMQFNRLTVNISKSKYMIIGSKFMLDRTDNYVPILEINQQHLQRVMTTLELLLIVM